MPYLSEGVLSAAVTTVWTRQLGANSVRAYAIAAATFLVCVLAIVVVARVIRRRAERRALAATGEPTKGLDPAAVRSLDRALVPLAVYGAFLFATRTLVVTPRVERITGIIGVVLLAFYGSRLLLDVATRGLSRLWLRRGLGDENRIHVLTPFLQVLVWLVALVFVLDNLQVKISTVLTGLGIGGIAVALAAQAVLGDLFAYVAIVLDQPFALGDAIAVDTFTGTVEHIGIKTTRVRSLGGELLIFPNASLVSSRIRNYRPQRERRIEFSFGVHVGTPPERLAAIPQLVRGLVEAAGTPTAGVPADLRFDRCHFQSITDAALVFVVVYVMLTPDYGRYMDVQQAVNLALLERLRSEGVSLAEPARATVLVRGEGADAASPAREPGGTGAA